MTTASKSVFESAQLSSPTTITIAHNADCPFEVGALFHSYDVLREAVESYKNKYYIDFWIRDARTIDAALKRGIHRVEQINKDLKYYEIKYCCTLGGRKFQRKAGSLGLRNKATVKLDCEAHIALRASDDGKCLQVRSISSVHNHKISKELYEELTKKHKPAVQKIKTRKPGSPVPVKPLSIYRKIAMKPTLMVVKDLPSVLATPKQQAKERKYRLDTDLKNVRHYLEFQSYLPGLTSTQKTVIKRLSANFLLSGDVMYHTVGNNKREAILSQDSINRILRNLHDDNGHPSRNQTQAIIRKHYYWTTITSDVMNWVQNCTECRSKGGGTGSLKGVQANGPWEMLCVDVIGPLIQSNDGNEYILSVTDYFTRWIEVFPVTVADELTVANSLSKLFYRFGPPKEVFIDKRVDFCRKVMEHMLLQCHCEFKVSPIKNQIKATDERTVQILIEELDSIPDKRGWDLAIEPIMYGFRIAVLPNMTYTPFELMFNRKARSHHEPSSTDYDWDEYMVNTTERSKRIRNEVLNNLKQDKSVSSSSTPSSSKRKRKT